MGLNLVKGWTALRNVTNPLFRDMVNNPGEVEAPADVEAHIAIIERRLGNAMRWMLYNQEHQPDGGIAGLIEFVGGELKASGSYPETTGYSVPTLFDAAALLSDKGMRQAALKAADFLLTMQGEDGSFPGGLVGELTGPSVFNSAQIVDGLIRAHAETGALTYLDSAARACDWMCGVQEPDGAWGKFNYLGEKRVYDSKVSEALLRVHATTRNAAYLDAANKNLDWVLSRQKENGWFHDCDNSSQLSHMPLTHTIGYTAQGLLECHLLTGRGDLLDSAKRTLYSLLDVFESGSGLPPARFYEDWRPAAQYSCVTGDAQTSICWTTLYSLLDDRRLLEGAMRMNRLLGSIQIRSDAPELNGSLPSSWPADGDYFPYKVNNWSIKYFADALIKEHGVVASSGPTATAGGVKPARATTTKQ